MKNLNNTKLTNQEKEHMLRCSIDADYKKKVEKAEKEGAYYPPHMWLVSHKSVVEMNNGAIERNSLYSFYEDALNQVYPLTDFILLECERVLEGEWDSVYERWSPYSYQRVFCLALNGVIDETDLSHEKGFYTSVPTAEEDAMGYELYPLTFDEKGENKGGFIFGLLDCPIENEETMDCFSKMENRFGCIPEYKETLEDLKRNALSGSCFGKGTRKARAKNKTKKTKKELKKQFKGGFI